MDPAVAAAIALFFACVMFEAGGAKLLSPAHYARILDDYRLLPKGAGRWLAPPLGAFESLLACGLLWESSRTASLYGCALLLTLYALAMGINLARGRRHIDCGCGGGSAQELSPVLLLRNAVLVGVALLPLLSTPAPRPMSWLDWASAGSAGIAASLLYFGAVTIIANALLLARLR